MLVWAIRRFTPDEALEEQGNTLAAQFGSQYDLRPVWGVHREGDRRRGKVALSAGEVAAVWPGRGFTLRPDGSLPPDVLAAEPHRRCERLSLNRAALAYRIAVRLNFIGGQARTAPALPRPRGRDQVDL